MIQGVTIEEYNFETYCHKLEIRGLGRYNGSKYTIINTFIIYVVCLSQIACTGFFALSKQVWYRTVLWVVGSHMSFGGTVAMNCYLSPI